MSGIVPAVRRAIANGHCDLDFRRLDAEAFAEAPSISVDSALMEKTQRLENLTEEPLYMIEVQCGDYLGEDDIERLNDAYNRG